MKKRNKWKPYKVCGNKTKKQSDEEEEYFGNKGSYSQNEKEEKENGRTK